MAVGEILAVVGILTEGLQRFMTFYGNRADDYVEEPPFTSLIVCSLNEEGFISRTLESIECQNVFQAYPDSFEKIVVDSHSQDRTVEIAEAYGWTVYQADRGKLNARHLGMLKSRGEILFSMDADSIYPPNYMNLLLRWFKQSDVVAVVAPRLCDPHENPVATKLSVWMSLIDVGPLLAGGMRAPGQSMALRRAAYFSVGGFNLNINQQNVHEMVREEEIRFAAKLRQLGRVPVEWKAACYTSLRRVKGIGKGEHYKQWQKARQQGERF